MTMNTTRPMAGMRDNSMLTGRTQDVLEVAFGPRDADAHVKAWTQHQFRRSDAGRRMMRARLKSMYPTLPASVALAVYSVRHTTSYMELEYI
jgi:hypothetical protein